jgi:hypothetical protein
MLKKIKYIITAAISVISLNTSATLISNTFENGIPASWDCKGNCGTSSANGVVTTPPTGNKNYGWVSTDAGVAKVGLSGLLGADGSILRSNLFSANSGDSLEFYFNYVTSDGAGFSDYAWSRLLDDSFTQVAMLFTARTDVVKTLTSSKSPTMPIIHGAPNWAPLGKNSGDCWKIGCGYTGWTQSNYSITNTGNYYLEFGVANWADKSFDSGLAFDGITIEGVAFDALKVTEITTNDATSVPETTSIYLFALALISLISLRRSNI